MTDRWSAVRRDTSRRARRGVAAIAVIGAPAFALAACGGGNAASPGVANLGSTTTTTPATATGSPQPFGGPQQQYQYELAYAACMRTHGVPNFPDPTATSHRVSFNSGADSGTPQFTSANNACKHLLPDDGGPPTAAQVATETTKLLKYASCMRAHGEPNFPDPTINSHEIGFSLNGIDPQSPQFQDAQQACTSLGVVGLAKGAP